MSTRRTTRSARKIFNDELPPSTRHRSQEEWDRLSDAEKEVYRKRERAEYIAARRRGRPSSTKSGEGIDSCDRENDEEHRRGSEHDGPSLSPSTMTTVSSEADAGRASPSSASSNTGTMKRSDTELAANADEGQSRVRGAVSEPSAQRTHSMRTRSARAASVPRHGASQPTAIEVSDSPATTRSTKKRDRNDQHDNARAHSAADGRREGSQRLVCIDVESEEEEGPEEEAAIMATQEVGTDAKWVGSGSATGTPSLRRRTNGSIIFDSSAPQLLRELGPFLCGARVHLGAKSALVGPGRLDGIVSLVCECGCGKEYDDFNEFAKHCGEPSDPFRRALVLGDGDAMQTLEERLKQLFLVLQQHIYDQYFEDDEEPELQSSEAGGDLDGELDFGGESTKNTRGVTSNVSMQSDSTSDRTHMVAYMSFDESSSDGGALYDDDESFNIEVEVDDDSEEESSDGGMRLRVGFSKDSDDFMVIVDDDDEDGDGEGEDDVSFSQTNTMSFYGKRRKRQAPATKGAKRKKRKQIAAPKARSRKESNEQRSRSSQKSRSGAPAPSRMLRKYSKHASALDGLCVLCGDGHRGQMKYNREKRKVMFHCKSCKNSAPFSSARAFAKHSEVPSRRPYDVVMVEDQQITLREYLERLEGYGPDGTVELRDRTGSLNCDRSIWQHIALSQDDTLSSGQVFKGTPNATTVQVGMYGGESEEDGSVLRQSEGTQMSQTLAQIPSERILYDEEFCRLSCLGTGAFASVHRALWYGNEGTQVAVKVIRVPDKTKIVHELVLMSKYRHPNIVTVYGACLAAQHPYLVMEYLPMTLGKKINEGPMEHVLAIRIARDIASAMWYLHTRNVVHRDLKPANILLSESLCAKVADFGMSAELFDPRQDNAAGTLRYMAPELVLNPRGYSHAVDVYAFGLILWEMIAGTAVFKGLHGMEAYKRTCKGERPPRRDSCPASLWSLMQDCWCHEPKDRLPFSAVLLRLSAIGSGNAAETSGTNGTSSVSGSTPAMEVEEEEETVPIER